jgi:hypothetical protein
LNQEHQQAPAAKAAIRVRMEAWRQRRGSQSAEDSSKQMVENEGADRRVGGAPGARMRRCLILRQGASPLRPPAPFPSDSMFRNGGNLSRVRKPRKNRAPLTDFLRSEDSTGMRERGPLKADASSYLPLVGPVKIPGGAGKKPLDRNRPSHGSRER